MSTRRTERVASLIREVVSTAILFELRDPRIQDVTVLRVEVSPDVRYAKVYVSVRGTEKEQALSMHGLKSARGLLQSKVGDFIKARYIPELRFVLDDGLKKSQETTELLKELFPDGAPPPIDEAAPGTTDDESAAVEAMPPEVASFTASTTDSGEDGQSAEGDDDDSDQDQK